MSQLGTSVDQVVERCSITFTAGDGRCAGIEFDPGAPTTRLRYRNTMSNNSCHAFMFTVLTSRVGMGGWASEEDAGMTLRSISQKVCGELERALRGSKGSKSAPPPYGPLLA